MVAAATEPPSALPCGGGDMALTLTPEATIDTDATRDDQNVAKDPHAVSGSPQTVTQPLPSSPQKASWDERALVKRLTKRGMFGGCV